MMDTGSDHTAEPAAITGYDPAGHHDDQGPASWERPAAVAAKTGGYAGFKCGTIAARTRFIVMYRAEGGDAGVAEFESCCRNWEHEPPDFAALIDEAEVLQIDIADGHEQEITTNETITTRENPAPGHYIDPANPWAWTLIDGLPETVVPIDEVDIEVRPKPADVP
jgi:hypothetical protein